MGLEIGDWGWFDPSINKSTHPDTNVTPTEAETTQAVGALQAELEGIKDSMRRELTAQKGKLGEAENKLARKDSALQAAQAALKEREEALQRKGAWVGASVGWFLVLIGLVLNGLGGWGVWVGTCVCDLDGYIHVHTHTRTRAHGLCRRGAEGGAGAGGEGQRQDDQAR